MTKFLNAEIPSREETEAQIAIMVEQIRQLELRIKALQEILSETTAENLQLKIMLKVNRLADEASIENR